MVTYEEIYRAWLAWNQTKGKPEWNDLWIKCAARMGALVKHRAKNLTVPLPEGDIDDLITDGTCRVMVVFVSENVDCEAFVSKTFHFENRTAFRYYNLAKRKEQRLIKEIRTSNSFLRFSGKTNDECSLL